MLSLFGNKKHQYFSKAHIAIIISEKEKQAFSLIELAPVD